MPTSSLPAPSPTASPTPSTPLESVPADYAVRIGTQGHVYRLASDEGYRRGERVVCRTSRGLEAGSVLTSLSLVSDHHAERAGRILRRMTPEDHLLWSNLQVLASEAYRECCEIIEQSTGSATTLLEVEPLLDGRTLYFHFLSAVDAKTEVLIESLVASYQRTVMESQFARLLEHGCGPGCGTDKATRGCGTGGGCVVCKVASACSSKKS